MSLFTKKFFYGIALTIAAVAFWGCSQPVDPPADITWTAEADGASGATTSTKINLTFAGSWKCSGKTRPWKMKPMKRRQGSDFYTRRLRPDCFS
jgi:hypothetical protein